jgi:hypothetical protein
MAVNFAKACMARFIIADLTDPSSIPKELDRLAVPVRPLLERRATARDTR